MNQVREWLGYLQDNPMTALAAVGVLVVAYFLLNHKSRLAREADKRLADLRKEKGDIYNKTRPMQ